MATQRTEWTDRIQASVARALALLDRLDVAALNHRESLEDWSIGQHLEHLSIVTALVQGKVASALDAAARGAEATVLWRPNWLERKFIDAVGPQPPGRATPVPAVFVPGDGPYDPAALRARFLSVHNDFAQLIAASTGADLRRVKAASAALPLLKVSIGCWFESMAIHIDYHVGRAVTLSPPESQ